MNSDDRKVKGRRPPRSVDGVVHTKKKTTKTTVAETPAEPKLLAAKTPALLRAQHLWLRRTLLVALPVLGVVGVVWVIGNLYFMQYSIGDVKVPTHSSRTHLEGLIANTTDTYRLKIAEPQGAIKTYTLKDMGIQANVPATLTALHERQQSWSARLQWWKPVAMQVRLRTDTAGLQNFIKTHVSRTVEPAKDASITLENGEVKLTDGSVGKQYGLTNPVSTILSAAERLQSAPLRIHQVALQPAIASGQLAGVRSTLERTLHQKVAVKVGDQSVVPEPKDIAGWLKLIPDPTKKTVAIESDKETIRGYLDKVASDHFQPPKAQLTNGSATIPGVAGTRVTGTETVANTITDKLLAAQGVDVSLPVQRTPFKTVSAPLTGRWIVVDLTTKRMYAYQQTNLVKTFLVSAGAPGTPTPTGRYAVYSKFARQNMTGPNADGTRYNQPNVPWISYFYQDYAIHGNYWRPVSYFGNINSSHGCVGVTTADAAWVYNWAVVGTPIIIHT